MATVPWLPAAALLALALRPDVAYAQASGADAPGEEIVAEILRLDSIWLNAYVTADVEAVRPILADGFVGQLVNTIADKDVMLQRVAASEGVIGVPADRLVVNFYGDVAVIHALRRWITLEGDAEVTAPIAYTDVYRYEDGRWVAITGQSAAVPEG